MTANIEFDYTEVLPFAGAERASSLIASLEPDDQPLRAVVWSVPHRSWIYAPGPAARILYGDEHVDRLREIDRPTAERVARDDLQAELPSEAALLRICLDGEASGLTHGPPRP